MAQHFLRLPLSHRWLQAAIGSLAALGCGSALAAPALPVTPLNKQYLPPAKHAKVVLTQRGTYDSNPLRLVRGYESLYGTESIGELTLASRTPDSELASTSTVSYGVFSDNEFDTTNFHQALNLNTRNDRWKAGLLGKFDYDTTRSSEITSYGIRAPNVRHNQFLASPSMSVRITKANSIALNGSIMKSTYDSTAFTDYKRWEVAPAWLHKLDDVHTFTAEYEINRYQTMSGPDLNIDTQGPSFGIISEMSPSLKGSFNAGFQKSERSRTTGPAATRHTTQNNYVYRGLLTYQTDQQKLDISATRSQQPTGNGTSGLFTTLRVAEDYLLSQRLSLRGEALYRDVKYIRTPRVNLDSEIRGSGGIAYRIYQNLDFTTNYIYSRQKLTSGVGTVNAHSVLFGISLHPAEKEL